MNERMNIRRMQAPERKTDPAFDAKRDISERDWERIFQRITFDFDKITPPTDMVAAVKLLNPKYPYELDDLKRDKLREHVSNDRVGSYQHKALMKCIDSKLAEKPSAALFKEMEDRMASEASSGSYVGLFSTVLESYLILHNTHQFALSNEVKQGIEAELAKHRAMKRWTLFLRLAAVYRLACGEPVITEEDWVALRADLAEERRKNNSHDFTMLARDQQILAADKVSVTDSGIEIRPHVAKKATDQHPPQPESLTL